MFTQNKGIFVRTTKYFITSLSYFFQKVLICVVSYSGASSPLGLCLLTTTLHYYCETTEAMLLTSDILFYCIFRILKQMVKMFWMMFHFTR